MPGDEPYRDHWEHLDAELCRLEAGLTRLAPPGQSAPPWWPRSGTTPGDPDTLDAAIAGRVKASRAARVLLPLVTLADEFDLASWELTVVLLSVAVGVEPGYRRLFAWAQGDPGATAPTIELALRFLTNDLPVRARGRLAFAERARLHRAGVTVTDNDQLALDPAVLAYLLSAPATERDRAPGDGRLARLAEDALTDGDPLVVCLHGAGPASQQEAAEAIVEQLSTVDLPALIAAGQPFEPAVRSAVRDAALHRSGVLLTGADQLGETHALAALRLRQVADAIDDLGRVVFVGAREPVHPEPPSVPWLAIDATGPDLGRRSAQWLTALTGAGLPVDRAEADALAARYRLTGVEMHAAIDTAVRYAWLHDHPLTVADVEHACRTTAGRGLGGLGRRIAPRYGWADLVLPDDQRQPLAELADAVRHRRTVLDDWGFGARLSRGTGLSALFSGPPGTGKTMAAEVIASETGLDLYVVDLATVVSKYIGETEQNLARVFDAAESAPALLFFDEADALFGKRSEVRDAHDRYANIEISYLLQRVETYTGLVVLATNLRRNLDDAFLRRISVVVDFTPPAAFERERLWRGTMPDRLPVTDDVDWDFLATRFPVTGGTIKGAVLHAAYRAAARHRPVGMADLLRGLRREITKSGKVSTPADFAPYAHLLTGDDHG